MPRHRAHGVNLPYEGHCPNECDLFLAQVPGTDWVLRHCLRRAWRLMSGHAVPVSCVSGDAVVTAVSQQSGLLFPGRADAFIIRFVCNDDVYPGTPKFLHQDIDSSLGIRDTFFEFETALACVPSPVDCQVTGETGWKCVCVPVSICVCICACVCVFYFQAA